jgi:hypothetical protein
MISWILRSADVPVHTYNDELSCIQYALRYELSPLCGAEIWSRGKIDQKCLGSFET